MSAASVKAIASLEVSHAGGPLAGAQLNAPSKAGAPQQVVAAVILAMRNASEERLNLDKMAKMARMSRFHFNRVFHRVTGVPPGQFQSILRLALARKLLITTRKSVIDISFDVGYDSLGTFTRRFSDLVGIPPYRFRRIVREIENSKPALPLPESDLFAEQALSPSVSGAIEAGPAFRGVIFIGLFATPVPQSMPVACAMVTQSGEYRLNDVPDGRYFLFAAAIREGEDPVESLSQSELLRAAPLRSPLVVARGKVVSGDVDLRLRAPEIFDPPILTALLPLSAGWRPGQFGVSNSGEDSTPLTLAK